MSAIGTSKNTSATSASSSSSSSAGNGVGQLDLDSFLKLLISELQNQDPLNPMDNTQMVQQLATLREIGANDQLTESLNSFSITQQLTTASSLIGQTIDGLSDDGSETTGVVDRVSVITDSEDLNKRSVKVHVGSQTIEVKNIRQIQPTSA